ncbi:hypothetical protein GCM10010317_026120 [Streptomyces mirabilis]|nr:hypothetical protein GCM10010317_026120 [Streptomyces mirabilis]
MSNTATETAAPFSSATAFIALASRASRSTVGSVTGSTDASWLGDDDAADAEDDVPGDAEGEDTRLPRSCACAFTYTAPAAVPPTRTAEATTV